jgi:hypothetical protein
MADVSKCICGSTPNVCKRKEVFGQSSLFTVMCLNENCGIIAESKSSIASAVALWNNNILYLEKKKKEEEDKTLKDYTPKMLCHCGISPHIEVEKSECSDKVRYAVFCGRADCYLRSDSKDTMEDAVNDWNEKIMREQIVIPKFDSRLEAGREFRVDKKFRLVCNYDDKLGIQFLDGRWIIDPANTSLLNNEVLSIFEGMKSEEKSKTIPA